MGILKQRLKHMGYNAKERAYVYSGAIIGALAPILSSYLMFKREQPDNWIGEAVAWGGALFLNTYIMIAPPYAPIPVYTAAAGVVIGDLAARNSRIKRAIKKEKGLENLTKNSLE